LPIKNNKNNALYFNKLILFIIHSATAAIKKPRRSRALYSDEV